MDFKHRLPGEPRQLTEKMAVEAEELPQPLGDREDELPVGDGDAQVAGMCSAMTSARFWWQLGQRQRRRQEKATKNSYRQRGQRTRAKPSRRSPQARYFLTVVAMTGRQKP